jgi:uncharacterized protein (DUF2237 family)
MNLQESIRRILREEITEDKNLYGEKLKPCSTNPMTGFYRDGYCRTGDDDTGSHTVCAKVTEEFLEFTNSMGNNLDMLEPGDKWCLFAKRWEEANKEGVAPEMIKSSTNIKTLDIINGVEQELDEYARTLKNARKHGTKLRFPKSAIKANPQRFRKYTRDNVQESDPKTGTGKKPGGSSRRLYTDENSNDTVSVKFRTKQDIIDTLNKSSFKSKPHKRQSQIINLIHQRVRAAYQNAKDPETKKRLKTAYDYIETVKEKSKQKTIRLQKQKVNESETSDYNELIYTILERFKEEDCICDIKISFDVEDGYYNVYLVFSQEELHYKFSSVLGIRNYITEMMNDAKNDLKAFLPIKNIFIGYYSKPNCGWSPLNESEDDEEKNLNVLKELISMFDYSEVCDMWVEYDPEDGYYAIRSKMNTKNHNTKALEKEFEFLEESIKSLGLKAYISHPYWVEECEDKNELNESEDKNQSLLSLIEEHGLYEFMKMTGLSMGQIILKYDNLPREVFERYIKDFINEEGYHQTDGSVQLVYVVKIQTHVYIDHFYMKGDKVTLEISRIDNRGYQTEGYIESLSNLTDDEIFSIVDDMTQNIVNN